MRSEVNRTMIESSATTGVNGSRAADSSPLDGIISQDYLKTRQTLIDRGIGRNSALSRDGSQVLRISQIKADPS